MPLKRLRVLEPTPPPAWDLDFDTEHEGQPHTRSVGQYAEAILGLNEERVGRQGERWGRFAMKGKWCVSGSPNGRLTIAEISSASK